MGVREKIAEIRTAAAPSMVPAARVPEVQVPQQQENVPDIPGPPPKEEEVIPDIGDIVKDRKARIELARLVERHGELGAELGPLKKERDGLTDKIKRLAGTHGIGKAMCGLWRINYYAGTRSSLDEKKLMQSLLGQGVQPAVVNKALMDAKKVTTSYTLKISAQGEKEEE